MTFQLNGLNPYKAAGSKIPNSINGHVERAKVGISIDWISVWSFVWWNDHEVETFWPAAGKQIQIRAVKLKLKLNLLDG